VGAQAGFSARRLAHRQLSDVPIPAGEIPVGKLQDRCTVLTGGINIGSQLGRVEYSW